MPGLGDGIICPPVGPLSPDCKRCCRTLRKLLKEFRLTSEKDVTKEARDDNGDGEGRALSSGSEPGSEEVAGTVLSSSKASSWEGMSRRSSVPFLLGGMRGVVAALLRKWPS